MEILSPVKMVSGAHVVREGRSSLFTGNVWWPSQENPGRRTHLASLSPFPLCLGSLTCHRQDVAPHPPAARCALESSKADVGLRHCHCGMSESRFRSFYWQSLSKKDVLLYEATCSMRTVSHTCVWLASQKNVKHHVFAPKIPQSRDYFLLFETTFLCFCVLWMKALGETGGWEEEDLKMLIPRISFFNLRKRYLGVAQLSSCTSICRHRCFLPGRWDSGWHVD